MPDGKLHGAITRVAAGVGRRIDRPELAAVVNWQARFLMREDIAAAAIVPVLLGARSTFVDVGANRGQWLDAAVRCAPHGRHVAYEPNRGLCEEITRRHPTVDVRPVALSDASGTAQFCQFRRLDGFSGLVQRPEITDEFEMVDVRVGRLDDELGEIIPTVIKIDVEGAEVNVLLGATETLSAHNPTVIFEHQTEPAALYDHGSAELWSLLTDLDYRIFALQGAGPLTSQDFVAAAQNGTGLNWLAVPNSR